MIVPQEDVERLIALPQIIYVEKPKRLYFSIAQGKSASCINPLQYGSENLTGKGVLVAVIDSGIDYYHEDFRNVDGSSRILRLWDQVTGNVYTKEELDLALTMGSRDAALTKVPSIDVSGHGTAVAGIAAGNGRGGRGAVRGIAYESSLLIVKLGSPLKDSFPRTTQLMRAMQFAVEQAEYFKMPLVVNLSFGNSYGSHDGSSLLETYLDTIADIGRVSIVVGTGNEGSGEGHHMGMLREREEQVAEFWVVPFETGINLQLWKSYVDEFDVSLLSPSGVKAGPISQILGAQQISCLRIKFFYIMENQVPTALHRKSSWIFFQEKTIWEVECGN